MHPLRIVVLPIAALLAACTSTGPGSVAPDVAAIRTARAEQNRAIADGDADRIASFWTDDVTVRSGLGALVTGRAAYRERIVGNGPAGRRLVYVRMPRSIEIGHHWPLAFETGTWTARLGDIRGAEMMGGRYSAQWVKRNGRWLIRSEVFVALTCEASGCDAAAAP
jgi:ketosteroid isomerase-like protein